MNKKRKVFFIALTAAVVLFVVSLSATTIGAVQNQLIRFCFDKLSETSEQLANELNQAMKIDHSVLSLMADVIAGTEADGDAVVCRMLSDYSLSTSYISYMELLRPDGTMLDADGTVRDVSAILDFQNEAQRGAYISNVEQSTKSPDEKVIRNAVPVQKNGETVGVLYGVVRLSDLAQKYTTNAYGGHANVYVIDGDTGDFILDTWHDSLGNINDMGDRNSLPGNTVPALILDLQNSVEGEIGFMSKTTGSILYMHYEPLAVNNWSVMISVEDKYALHEGSAISARLYLMAGLIGAALILYMACVTVSLFEAYRQVRRLGTHDLTTDLQNRNAFDEFVLSRKLQTYESVLCVYIDVDGLHEVNNQYSHAVGDQMLRFVADALKSQFDSGCIYRIGGDEFTVISHELDPDDCEKRMEKVEEQVGSHHYHISYGISFRENEIGVDRAIREADERMLENKRLYYANHDRRSR